MVSPEFETSLSVEAVTLDAERDRRVDGIVRRPPLVYVDTVRDETVVDDGAETVLDDALLGELGVTLVDDVGMDTELGVMLRGPCGLGLDLTIDGVALVGVRSPLLGEMSLTDSLSCMLDCGYDCADSLGAKYSAIPSLALPYAVVGGLVYSGAVP